MRSILLEILCCPACQESLILDTKDATPDDEIETGELVCDRCKRSFPIINGIPRFVPAENYADTFGFQWNEFRTEQLDSKNGGSISEERFFSVTGWEREWLGGKLILDAGCGAGRFLDISTKHAGTVVGVDLSNAVDASKSNLVGSTNVHLVQASLYELPFRQGTFDATYCIGVVQHTPHPKRSLQYLAGSVKPNGRIGLFIYERNRWTKFYSKYLMRPVTTKLSQNSLLFLIKATMPILFPLTEVLFRIPIFARYFIFMIPISNYVGANTGSAPDLTLRQRYQWAIMDTFDMLAPAYDEPMTFDEVSDVLLDGGFGQIKRTGGIGLCIDGFKVDSNSGTEKNALSP